MDLDGRRVAHDAIHGLLSASSDDALRVMVSGVGPTWTAWGGHQVVSVGDHEVFFKRVPVTDRELADPGSTRNVFELPVFYSYGVGSAGFGANRERETHLTATGLVLAGVCSSFPLLHHHRVMPRSEKPPAFPVERDRYVAMWNNNAAVADYFDARQAATHELWLFAERLPHVIAEWLPQNLDQAPNVVHQLRAAAAALHGAGVVHFDAHFGNALTDGNVFYLSDFGLALSEHFDLTAEERAFLDDHRCYDHAEILWSLTLPLPAIYQRLVPNRRVEVDRILGNSVDPASHDFLVALVGHLDGISEPMDLAGAYSQALGQYADVILETDTFIRAIRQPDKQARFNTARFERLLAAADAVR